jgi:hypothetical protein
VGEDSNGVTVTLDQMWQLLQSIEHTVLQSLAAHESYSHELIDHEERLRLLESRSDVAYRVGELEAMTRRQQQQLDELRRRVWAIPTAASLAAVVAIAVGVASFLSR